MMNDAPIDDGSDRPLGYTTADGHLEVRESVDSTGEAVRGYHETDLGQHDRWLRQAPDLFEKYVALQAQNAGLRDLNKELLVGGDYDKKLLAALRASLDQVIAYVQQWREQAAKSSLQVTVEGFGTTAGLMREIEASTFRQCADELSTLLASQDSRLPDSQNKEMPLREGADRESREGQRATASSAGESLAARLSEASGDLQWVGRKWAQLVPEWKDDGVAKALDDLIATVLAAKDEIEKPLVSHHGDGPYELLAWFADRLKVNGYKALPCAQCHRQGNISVHLLHTALRKVIEDSRLPTPRTTNGTD